MSLTCNDCENVRINFAYDAEYCVDHDCWISQKCGDDTCKFCVDRPEKPSLVEK